MGGLFGATNGRRRSNAASDDAMRAMGYDIPNPGVGDRILNQIGMNLLGVDVLGMKRREAMRKAQMGELSSFIGDLQPGWNEPDPIRVGTPDVTGQMADPGNADAWQGFLPQRTAPKLSIDSPELASRAMRLKAFGIDPAAALDVMKAQQPEMRVAPDGSTFNAKSASGVPQRFSTPTTINGWNVDAGDPKNRGAYFPQLQPGLIPDGKGGVVNVTGLTGALGAQEEAQTLGRTRGTMFRVPMAGGREGMMTGSQYLGGAQGEGAGVTTAPADLAYDSDVAKATATQYNAIQTAGQRASASIATYNRMSNLLEGIQTGRFTPAMKEFQSAASSLGVKVDPRWGNIEAANALASKLTLDALGGSLGAGFSNADRSFVENMNPAIVQTPQGRAQIVAFGVARAKRDQQIAQMARKWQQGNGRLDKPDRNGKSFFDYLDAWAEANPLMPRR